MMIRAHPEQEMEERASPQPRKGPMTIGRGGPSPDRVAMG